MKALARRRSKASEEHPVPVILLVEDDPDIRGLLAQQLTRGGFHVLTAGDAASAVMTCRLYPDSINIMLTDLNLPGVSGSELARAAITIRPTMKVVYISGKPQHVAVERGLIPPGAVFIAKPYTVDHVTATLHALTNL